MQNYPKMDVTLQKKEAKIRRKGTKVTKKVSTAKSASVKAIPIPEEPRAVAVPEAAATSGLANLDLRKDLIDAPTPSPAPKARKKKEITRTSMRRLHLKSDPVFLVYEGEEANNICTTRHIRESYKTLHLPWVELAPDYEPEVRFGEKIEAAMKSFVNGTYDQDVAVDPTLIDMQELVFKVLIHTNHPEKIKHHTEEMNSFPAEHIGF